MDERLLVLRCSLQDSLDDLSSPRSSTELKSQALQTIERLLAQACVAKDNTQDLHNFNALQYTFECNVPLRLLSWISLSTSALDALTNKGTMDHERELQAARLSSQLALSLSLIQGIALNHSASKEYLGRKYALEVLLDLLLASRHLSSMGPMPADSPSSSSSRPSTLTSPLTSVVLDTLLCILVDSPPALRAFEISSGVQAVVKILKRAGTPREVRMKCLEFLYFYLLDEKPSPSNDIPQEAPVMPTPPSTAPTTPYPSSKKPFISGRPLRPSSQSRSSSSLSPASSSSSRSTSGSSTHSFSSTSSNTSSSTTSSSGPPSPDKASATLDPKTPPNSPPLAHRQPQQLQPRSLMMLRKEVDFVPLSPKKPQVSRSGVGISSRHTSGKSISRSRLGSRSEEDVQRRVLSSMDGNVVAAPCDSTKMYEREKTRTTEEKKELLGTMLGNVDALVEGVRKAGIWGLG